MSRTLPERTKPGAISTSDMGGLSFQAGDDRLDVAQQVVDVEARADLVGRQPACDRLVRLDQLAQLAPLVRSAQRGTLDDRVRVLTRQATLLHQRGQEAAAGKEPQAALGGVA